MYTATQSIREIIPQPAILSQSLSEIRYRTLRAGRSFACQCLPELAALSSIKFSKLLLTQRVRTTAVVAFDPEGLPLGRLIQHIVRVHHHGIRQELPRLAGNGL